MNIFDCHANVGVDINNLHKNLYPTGQSTQQLLSKMNEHAITKAIIVPFPVPAAKFNRQMFWYEFENQHLISASRQFPNLIPFPAVNPADNLSVHNINTLAVAYKVKGVKFSHQIPMHFNIDKLIGHPLMDIIKKHSLIMLMHIGTGKERGADEVHVTLEYAIKVAKFYPHITFIFCHLGRLHKSILDALALSNIYFDTAALSMLTRWQQFIAKEPLPIFKSNTPVTVIEQLVGLGHEDKLIFGSDEPYTTYESEIEIFNNAKISQTAKTKILSGNISRLLEKKR